MDINQLMKSFYLTKAAVSGFYSSIINGCYKYETFQLLGAFITGLNGEQVKLLTILYAYTRGGTNGSPNK